MRTVVFALLVTACACEPARPPAAPLPVAREVQEEEDASFLRSEKLDEDVQELVVRAFGSDVPFTFEVRVAQPLDPITRERFAERGVEVEPDPEGSAPAPRAPRVHRVRTKVGALGLVTGDERVRAVVCAPPALPEGELPPEEAWRSKLERDVRTVVGARSACWFEVTIRFGHEPPPEERAFYEAHGARIEAWSADDAIAWVPVRFLPWIAMRDVVSFVEVTRTVR